MLNLKKLVATTATVAMVTAVVPFAAARKLSETTKDATLALRKRASTKFNAAMDEIRFQMDEIDRERSIKAMHKGAEIHVQGLVEETIRFLDEAELAIAETTSGEELVEFASAYRQRCIDRLQGLFFARKHVKMVGYGELDGKLRQAEYLVHKLAEQCEKWIQQDNGDWIEFEERNLEEELKNDEASLQAWREHQANTYEVQSS